MLIEELKKLAKDFNLKFRTDDFTYLVASKEEVILRNFLGGCPDPEYNKISERDSKKRIKNLDKFINSKVFLKEKEKPQGTAITLKNIKDELRLLKKIENIKIKRKLAEFYKNCLKKIKLDTLIIVSKPTTKENNFFKNVLMHELTHVLLKQNNIYFQKINQNYWKWDEGLVTYMDFFRKGEENYFKKKHPKSKNRMWDIYSLYARKWFDILKDSNNPVQRKKAILEIKRILNDKN